MPDGDEEWLAEAASRLAAEGDPEHVLRDMITWLDVTVASGDGASPRQRALTLLMLVAGQTLLRHHQWPPEHPVARTVAAAHDHVTDPTRDSFHRYFKAATASYPFGAGDGCYSLDEHTGQPGDGCRTGAGSLWQMALSVGPEHLLTQLRAEALPLLRPER
jgi:hypothetical protein